MDPHKPTNDMWGDVGGRLMVTSLSALTLEIYYRYLPLYKLDEEAGNAPPPAAKRDAVKPPPKVRSDPSRGRLLWFHKGTEVRKTLADVPFH